MQIEDALNLLDEMMDSSWSLPLSGGRCVVDVEKVRDIIDGIRVTLPEEFQKAEALLIEKDNIIAKAQEESERIIRQAEERARILLAQDEAVKVAQQRAADINSQANNKSKEILMAAYRFADGQLVQAEDTLLSALERVKGTRQALLNNTKK